MRLIRDWKHCPPEARGAVIALGNFDGVHPGHLAVLREARSIAKARGLRAAAMTFEPHPRRFFAPDSPPVRIYPFRSKAELIAGTGMEALFALRFNQSLAEIPAPQFVEEVLAKGLGAAHIVTGGDFMFGKGRGGDTIFLAEAVRALGFTASTVPPALDEEGIAYSSSRIRRKLNEGDMKSASALLGRPYAISGHVTRGEGRGKSLGFPTANLHFGRIFLPAHGVYAARIRMGNAWLDGVVNLGLRPTFSGQAPRLEAHCFDFDGNLYGKRAEVTLVEHLRGERRFHGAAELSAQIVLDCRRAKEILAQQNAEPALPRTEIC